MKKQFDSFVQTWRRVSFAALVLTLFASAAVAQKAQTAPVAATQKMPTMMWRVSDKAGKTVYLFGSIHLGKKEFYPFPAEIENAFNSSTKLLVEIDAGKVDQTVMQKLVVENGIYPGDETIEKYLSPASQEKLKKVMADYGLPYAQFVKFRPWLTAITIGVTAFQKSGYQADYGVDKHFLDRARDKKQIVEIETADFQIKALASMTNEEQVKYLENSLNEADKFGEYSQKLVAAWEAGSPPQLTELFKPTTPSGAEFNKKLIDDRNPRMADFAEQCLRANEKCFVVVGAAHIVGEKGMARILKDRGYKVEQISAAKK